MLPRAFAGKRLVEGHSVAVPLCVYQHAVAVLERAERVGLAQRLLRQCCNAQTAALQVGQCCVGPRRRQRFSRCSSHCSLRVFVVVCGICSVLRVCGVRRGRGMRGSDSSAIGFLRVDTFADRQCNSCCLRVTTKGPPQVNQ